MPGLKAEIKGREAELNLLHHLQAKGLNAKRNDQHGKEHGHGLPDVSLVIDKTPYHLEVKDTQRLKIHEAIRQAQRDAVESIPVVVHRRNGGEWYATLRLDDLLSAYFNG